MILEFRDFDWDVCRVMFSRDGHTVIKSLRTCIPVDQFIRELSCKAKEADRDISLKAHKDIKHCENPSHNMVGR